MRRDESGISWQTLLFIVIASVVGALATRYTNVLASKVETNFGYRPDPAGTREFLRTLDKPNFRQAGADCLAKAEATDAYLYRFADKAHRAAYNGKPYGPWNQGAAGTCVSFGWGMGSYVSQSVDWVTGKVEHPPKLVATEPIYGGSRTAARLPPVTFAGFSDGSYGGAAARWVAGLKNGTGGILYRERYGDVDLAEYSIDRSRQWGAYGVPMPLAKEANKHKAQAVALVDGWDSLVASLTSGYCVPICSNVGFAATKTRDADGFLPRGGNWSHCMVVIGCKFAANSGKNGEPAMNSPRDGALIMNSWGPSWCDGGKHPPDQPDGSFWVTRADIEAILRQGDSFAIGGVDGFAYRPVNHRDWLAPATTEEETDGR